MNSNPTGRLAAEHPGLVRLGRAGWLAKGVVYLLAGFLALLLAARSFGWDDADAGQEASPTGALKEVADSTGGPLLLGVLAVGLLLYVAWRLVSAALPGSTDAKGWAHRVGYVISAVIYATLAFTAIDLVTGNGGNADGNRDVTDWSQRIMERTAGRWLVGVIGIGTLAVGAYRVHKGATRDVNDELDLSRLGSDRARWMVRLGAVGEIGRGIGLGCIGFFLVRAAVTFRAEEATGLDGALRRLAEKWWGVVIVAAIAVGFLAYGAFCALTFPYRRLESL
jgi:hypothetical protein